MVSKPRKPRILIVGLGNLLLRDDGVGVHAVHELQKDPPPGIRIVEVGTAVLDALHLFEWANRILAIDAMQAGGEPGTIYSFGIDDVGEPDVQASLHELSLLAALRFLHKRFRPEIAVLGVEPEIMDYGLDLSPSVRRVLPTLLTAARDTVRRWESGIIEPYAPKA